MEDLSYSENENQSFGGGGAGGRFGGATTRDVYESIYSKDEQRELGLLDSGGSNPWGIASQFGGGSLQGFTTIKLGEDPKNTVEAIANNLGHLFGFMGVVPGLGTVGSTAAKGVVKGLGLASRTVGLGSKAARYGKQTAKGLSGFRSVPFLAGDAVLKGAKAVGKTKAAGAVMKYMKRSPTLAKHFGKAGVGRDVAEGFLHMGGAGAASAWQGGVDQMMEAFLMTGPWAAWTAWRAT